MGLALTVLTICALSGPQELDRIQMNILRSCGDRLNISAHMDTQHQDAAARQLLRASDLQR